MRHLLQKLEHIESQHMAFFMINNIRLFEFVAITKMPVSIKPDEAMINQYKMPEEISAKLESLIKSYYSSTKQVMDF